MTASPRYFTPATSSKKRVTHLKKLSYNADCSIPRLPQEHLHHFLQKPWCRPWLLLHLELGAGAEVCGSIFPQTSRKFGLGILLILVPRVHQELLGALSTARSHMEADLLHVSVNFNIDADLDLMIRLLDDRGRFNRNLVLVQLGIEGIPSKRIVVDGAIKISHDCKRMS